MGLWDIDHCHQKDSGNVHSVRINFLRVPELHEPAAKSCENVLRILSQEFHDIDLPQLPCMSRDDKRALAIMEESLKKANGHYQVALPWKNNSPNFPQNREVAERRLKGLQKKLLASPALCKQYCEKMSDYVESGYASVVPVEAPAVRGKTLYIPHFCTSVLTKFRVVFDCSAKFDGVSLNDELLQGPDLVTRLLGVLIRFRQEAIAVVGEIKLFS